MATNATAQWWIRTDGADANGGGYDSGIASAGTNYCNQASAQATWSQLTLISGTMTDPLSGGLFQAAMIGSCVNVPGQGYYWVTAITTANIATVTPGSGATTSFTTQPGKLGGAFRNIYALNNGGGSVAGPGTASGAVSGNIINVRASGSGAVGSPDYTQSGYASYPSGFTWAAYNGTPYIAGNGLTFWNISTHRFIGLYVYATGSNVGTYGIFGQLTNCTLISCTVDAQNQAVDGVGGTAAPSSISMLSCELIGGGTSSLSGFYPSSYGNSAKNCKIHGWGAWGVAENGTTAGAQISNCAIYANVSGGVNLATTSAVPSTVDGCTIDNNGGDGIQISGTTALTWCRIYNNNITNNGTSSGYGIDVAGGTTAVNNSAVNICDWNNVYNNSNGNYNAISAGAHDVSINPNYTNAGAGQYTPATNAAMTATAPVAFA